MDVTNLIPRRLDPDSCITVGTQLASAIKKYKTGGGGIPALLDNGAQKIISRSQALDALAKEDLKMQEVDRAVDRCVVAWSDLHEALRRMFMDPEILPLTETEEDFLLALNRVNAACYPEGTEFIRWTFRRQWRQLSKMKKALSALSAEVATLGATVPVDRLVRYIDLYGKRLGITEGSEEFTDKAVEALEAWHRALGDLLFDLIAYGRDPSHTDVGELRELLLTPYEQQAELERQEEREQRAKRAAKKAKDEPEKKP